MKRLLLPLIALFLGTSAWAQISAGGTPPSWNKATAIPTEEVLFPNQNVFALRADAEQVYEMGGPYRVGVEVLKPINANSNGRWYRTSTGDRFWKLTVIARDAQALGVLFNQLFLPEGSELFVYNEDHSEKLGAFTSFNNSEEEWAIAPIRGASLTLEYYAPAEVTEHPILDIRGISYVFRGFEKPESRAGFGDSGPCQVNANCAEGDLWHNEQRSVVRIFTKAGSFFGFCSGALVRTIDGSCPPYILSADHCAENTSTSDFNQWVFYFNYEGPNCANPASEVGLTSESISGCDLVASSGVGTISAGSDFLLVELDNDVPSSYQPFYSGWSRESTVATNGVTIHHPSGDIKKISTYVQTLLTGSWPGTSTPNRHWQVYWTATANGHGTTEGGSSGSPLFNEFGEIVGVLSGGFSDCSNTSGLDYYGKFSTAWSMDGASANQRLAPWLDPDNTGIQTVPGTNPPCIPFSIEEQEDLQLALYPNPASDLLYWETTQLTQRLEVIDALGRVVLELEPNELKGEINVATWASGVYFLRMETSRNQGAARFIVP